MVSKSKRLLNSISHNKSNLTDSNQNQSKKEIGSSNKRKRRLENWQPIEIFVDLTAIDKGFNKTKYTYLSFDDFKSAIENVKDTLSKLIMVNISNENRELLKITIDLTSKGFDNSHYNDSLIKTGIWTDLIILIRYDDTMDSAYFSKPEIIRPNSFNSSPQVGIINLNQNFGLTEMNKEEYL